MFPANWEDGEDNVNNNGYYLLFTKCFSHMISFNLHNSAMKLREVKEVAWGFSARLIKEGTVQYVCSH